MVNAPSGGNRGGEIEHKQGDAVKQQVNNYVLAPQATRPSWDVFDPSRPAGSGSVYVSIPRWAVLTDGLGTALDLKYLNKESSWRPMAHGRLMDGRLVGGGTRS